MPTYTPLQSIELATSSSTVTFSNISQNYEDLVLVVSAIGSTAGADIRVQLNSDTGSNYSITRLVAYTTAFSNRASNVTYFQTTNSVGIGTTEFTASNFNFMNYSNTTTNKTMLVRHNQPQGSLMETASHVGLWRNTAAITSITFSLSSGSYAAGSAFDLYGVSPVAADTAQAFGGTEVYYDSSYVYHVFKDSGIFTPYRALTADVLVVAGGGSGGVGMGGGGGAGGLLAHTAQSLTSGTLYTVTIGAGGPRETSQDNKGSNGSNSQFGSLTASVGGGGGGSYANTGGANGGSGGGGSGDSASNGTFPGGSASPSGQGNAGGTGSKGSGFYRSGGGGGAGAAGETLSSGSTGGAGGIGSSSYSSWGSITGTGQLVSSTYYYAGGGGGGTPSGGSGGVGGSGGGGAGGNFQLVGGNGITNTGGGGGAAGGGGQYASGSGGSGLVIVRYAR
jgi:hypothetical protein